MRWQAGLVWSALVQQLLGGAQSAAQQHCWLGLAGEDASDSVAVWCAPFPACWAWARGWDAAGMTNPPVNRVVLLLVVVVLLLLLVLASQGA